MLPQLPALPIPPSWFPGHMMKFTRMLPLLLKKTNVVLEIRDSRLPLTSINRTLEGALRKWRLERGWDPNNPLKRIVAVDACEHIVVLNKRDLVPEWGMGPFRKAMESKFPHQRMLSASLHRPRDIRDLNEALVNIAKEYPHAMELNVLVIGMPNVGKSTLLNALRNMGIKGRTPKAFKTSSNPGMTQALSTRLKLSLDPLVYAYDSPGIMLPYLGRGPEGAERGVKLALNAGIKEGLYDIEALAAYLLYRLNVIDPLNPAYMTLLPANASPTTDLNQFLDILARRMGMLQRGGDPDLSRAAVYFVKWWREDGALLSASKGLSPFENNSQQHTTISIPRSNTQTWGFDFQWSVDPVNTATSGLVPQDPSVLVQKKMEQCIEDFIVESDREDAEENNLSPTQVKKKAVFEEKERRKMRYAARQQR